MECFSINAGKNLINQAVVNNNHIATIFTCPPAIRRLGNTTWNHIGDFSQLIGRPYLNDNYISAILSDVKTFFCIQFSPDKNSDLKATSNRIRIFLN